MTTTIHAELVRDKEAAKARIGLVLSNCGARVFAHEGALRALNRLGIHPDSIVKESIKAAVGDRGETLGA